MSQDPSPSRTGGGRPARTGVDAALLGVRTFRTPALHAVIRMIRTGLVLVIPGAALIVAMLPLMAGLVGIGG